MGCGCHFCRMNPQWQSLDKRSSIRVFRTTGHSEGWVTPRETYEDRRCACDSAVGTVVWVLSANVLVRTLWPQSLSVTSVRPSGWLSEGQCGPWARLAAAWQSARRSQVGCSARGESARASETLKFAFQEREAPFQSFWPGL